MKKEKIFSISKKLIILLVVITILPITFLGLINYRTSSNITENEIRSAASTQQVSASAQEQLAGMEEVARTAEQLNLLAHSLSFEIERFKV